MRVVVLLDRLLMGKGRAEVRTVHAHRCQIMFSYARFIPLLSGRPRWRKPDPPRILYPTCAFAGAIARLRQPADGDSGLLASAPTIRLRSEEHTSELQSRGHLVCRL